MGFEWIPVICSDMGTFHVKQPSVKPNQPRALGKFQLEFIMFAPLGLYNLTILPCPDAQG